jgi:hypothetical protein
MTGMSASHLPSDPAGHSAGPGGTDPSMEDILASIRRILSEDEHDPAATQSPAVAPEGAEAEAAPSAPESDVLILDPSMLVAEPPGPVLASEPAAAQAEVPPPPRSAAPDELDPFMDNAPGQPAPASLPPAPAPEADAAAAAPPPNSAVAEASPARSVSALLGPAAAEAAATSVAGLLRTLIAERQQVAVQRTGPTLEDLVREEIRPLLKAWLDINLPPLVERLVRAEIERVVGRIAL